jgi:Cu/Ag efflux protein CusF
MNRWLAVPFVGLVALAAIGEAAAQSNPLPSLRAERSVSAWATVQAIDLEKRTVVLKREDGGQVTVHADRRVKNLPQVRVGDRVQVNYRETIAVQVRRAGEIAPATAVQESLVTAKQGEKPAAVGTQQAVIVATIEAIHPETRSVVLRSVDGEVAEIRVRDPNNLKRVKVGDQVEVNYTSALAMSVTGAPAAASGSSPQPGRRATATDLNREELGRIQGAQ